jgi:hypothetical protein
MKSISLTQGQFAIVDNDDYEWLSKFKWYADRNRSSYYARRNKNGKYIKMCRLIMGLKYGDKRMVDHINGNGLDNRRCNLRICTNAENQHNQRPRIGTSEYKGVSLNRKNGYWIARIRVNGVRIYLGCSLDEKQAAILYDKAAIKYFGRFAHLNLPEGK